MLYGRSLTGKTTWARSLGRHLHTHRMLNTKDVAEGHALAHYHVLDDVDIKFFPGWKDWLGGMRHIPLRVLYRDTQNIEWGRPCVWTNNVDPRVVMRRSIEKEDGHFCMEDIEWMDANCVFIHIDQEIAIFHASTE